MDGKLALNFSYTFDSPIWKIHCQPESELVVVENRDTSDLSASFTVFSKNPFELLHTLQPDDSWWYSVGHMTSEKIILTKFDSDKNPKVIAYSAFDAFSGLIEMERNDFDKVLFEGEMVEETKGEDSKTIDVNTGMVAQKELKSAGADQNKKVLSPFHYQQGTKHFQTVADFISVKLSEEIKLGADYLEWGELIIIAYYTGENKKLDNKLLVMDQSQHFLLHETIGSSLQGISDNAFFILDNKLIFVQEKCTFMCYTFGL